jgi:hypothetical protein
MREWSDTDTSPKHAARGDVDVVVYSAIVLYYRAAVDNAVFADDRSGIDDNARHYHGSGSDPC